MCPSKLARLFNHILRIVEYNAPLFPDLPGLVNALSRSTVFRLLPASGLIESLDLEPKLWLTEQPCQMNLCAGGWPTIRSHGKG